VGERVTASVRIGGTKRTQEGAAPRRAPSTRKMVFGRPTSSSLDAASVATGARRRGHGRDGSMCSGSGNRYGGAAGKAKASPAALSGEAHLD